MDPRNPAQVFGEIADVYDRVRKPYPPELFDDVLDYADGVGRALEIGAGTGRGTAGFLERGVPVTAIEPDAGMAAILARRAPEARIANSTFEEFRPGERFGLVFSAEAWHWTAPETRWELTAAALAEGGTFALFWNNERLADPSRQKAFIDVFAELAPTVTIKDLSVSPERVWSQWPGSELVAATGFGGLTSRHYLQHVTVPGAGFAGLTQTRSQFRMLPPDVQERVLDRLAAVFGDETEMTIDTTLLLATRNHARRHLPPDHDAPVGHSETERSGEVWWARLDGRTPVVLLPGGRAIRVVPAATEEQRRGFVLLTGAEAADDETRERLLAAAVPSARATGAEVEIAGVGVVRVAFPQAGTIFCTWETALTDDDLIERIAVLPPDVRHQLETVMRLATKA